MKEALKMALDALEANPLEMVADVDGHMVFLKDQAITAIKEALAQPEQEPVAWRTKNFYENQEGWFYADWHQDGLTPQVAELLYTTPPQRTEQEPVVLKWQQAPIRTAWGDDMVVASIAIDNDHTLSLYCERDQTPKVDVMFAQRTWVGLTYEEESELIRLAHNHAGIRFYIQAAEAKLKEKNT
jgi:hypothetical protein